MKWKKKGLICSHETFNLDWYKKNTMVPLPYLVDDTRLRIFITMCDENNVGRVGYVDVNPRNPGELLDYTKEPVVDIGEPGCFDDNGIVTASLVRDDDGLRLYYSGYRLGEDVPYYIFSGLATSGDHGATFRKYSDLPILDKTERERFSRCSPCVMKEDDGYKLWYLADFGEGWLDNRGHLTPHYLTKYITSKDGIHWPAEEGVHCVDFGNGDEHGISKPSVWKEDGIYKMIYSIRYLSKGYRMGYAESADGARFVRMDDRIGIDVSASGWDSEMVCFGIPFTYKEKTFLFYCGNHYGVGGFGYAELDQK
jgi:hypothetical protein